MRLVALLGLILIALSVTPSDFQNQSAEHPAMNLPPSLRQHNWLGPNGPFDGSCGVASLVNELRWQGKPALAEYVKKNFAGAQSMESLQRIYDHCKLDYAYTMERNNVAFLEKAVATRRGCAVGVMPYRKAFGPQHMLNLVDLTATKACLLDNNSPNRYIWRERDDFLAEWKAAGSWAITPVYTPASPKVPR